jgi:hypothetical protein
MRLILLVFLLISIPAFGQERDLSSYLSNVVDLGGGSFGIVTGEVDENTLSFITVGDNSHHFFNGISVKFFNSDFEATAYLVKTFVIGNYTLALYQCDKPRRFSWRREHYDFFSSSSPSFRTFLDNGKSDNQWSNYREPVSLVSISNKIAVLQMRDQSIYSRGMPIFNDQGSMVGMIASRLSDEENITFEAIDFSAIENVLHEFSECKYFKIIPFGHKVTLCASEEIENFLRKREVTKTRRRNTKHKFSAAPAISSGVLILPSNNDIDLNSFLGIGWAVGVNLYLQPDQPIRVIFKPRIGQNRIEPINGSLFQVSGSEFAGMKFKFFEVPAMLEFVMNHNIKKNFILAFGYAPTFNYTTYIVHYDIVRKIGVLHLMDPGSSIFHKLLVELGMESRNAKWGLFYSAQLNRWVDPKFDLGRQYFIRQPFEKQKTISHYVGAEFSWRLWGNWLLKER